MTSIPRLSILASTMLLSLGLNVPGQAQQAPDMTFFVTSVGPGKGGDLGGLAGADAYCQTLAATAGAGGKTWRAYLSTNAGAPGGPVNARDRIGSGPWKNFKGDVVATSVDDLHGANNKITRETALTEKGTMVNGVGMQPNQHDAMTGSTADGRVPGESQPDLQQLVEQHLRQHHARPYRPHPQDPCQSGVLERGPHVSQLQPARSRRDRRQRPVLLLRAITISI